MRRNTAATLLQLMCFTMIAFVAASYFAFPSVVPALRQDDNAVTLCVVLFFVGLIGGSIIRD